MRTIILAAAILTAVPAAAQDGSLRQAMDLGEIVGKSEVCGLTINEDALVAYMRDRGLLTVDLTAVVDRGRRYEAGREMSPAGCAAVRAVAIEQGLSAG